MLAGSPFSPRRRHLMPLLAAVLLLPGGADRRACACTVFVLVRDGCVLLGNNEDFTKRGAVWFEPAAEGRLARVNVGFHGFLGFRDRYAQGGMNEAGLAFDASTVAEVPWQPDPAKQAAKNLPDKILDECRSVDEAIDYFRRFDCSHLANTQFLFADASGASAVIAWLPGKGLSITQRSTPQQVMTNSRLAPSGYRCPRWIRATRELDRPGEPLAVARQALDAVHQHGALASTSYSCIYDLKERRIHLYNLANFDEVVTFDLRERVAAGSESHLLKSLFSHSPDLDEIEGRPQRTDYGTRIQLPAAHLARFAGTYRPTVDPSKWARVEATTDALLVHAPGQPPATLHPEAPTVFRIEPDRGLVSFQLDEQGNVRSLTLHKQVDVFCPRVAD